MSIKGSFPEDLNPEIKPLSSDSSSRLNPSEKKVQGISSSLPPLTRSEPSTLPKLESQKKPSNTTATTRYSYLPPDDKAVQDELEKFNPFAEKDGYRMMPDKGPIGELKRKERALKVEPNLELPALRKSPLSGSTSENSSPIPRISPSLGLQRPNSRSSIGESASNVSSPVNLRPLSLPALREEGSPPLGIHSEETFFKESELNRTDGAQPKLPEINPHLQKYEGFTKPPLPPIGDKPKNN